MPSEKTDQKFSRLRARTLRGFFDKLKQPETFGFGLLIFLELRTCIHKRSTPPGRAFSRQASLLFLEIHKGFLRQSALPGGKIPLPSGIFAYEYRF